jgi:hypothetical protein
MESTRTDWAPELLKGDVDAPKPFAKAEVVGGGKGFSSDGALGWLQGLALNRRVWLYEGDLAG